MTFTKDNTIALAGSIVFHLLVLVILLTFGLERTIPSEEVGTIVNFGNIDEASGMFEPAGVETSTAETAPAVEALPKESETKEMITQDMEQSLALAEKKKKDAERVELEKQHMTEANIKAEQERQAAAIRNQTASVFGKSSGRGASQGTAATGTGNQGSTNGSVLSSGNSSYGGYSLSGRTVKGSLPRPSYSIQEDGVVVVKIIVNPKGSVISATISLQGTNTDNQILRNAALDAARQAKFNTIGGTQNQTGTITYRYQLK